MLFKRTVLILSVLPLWAAGCFNTGGAAKADIDDLIAHEQYEQALRLAAARAERRPRDEGAQEDHRQASIAWLMQRARRLTFDGKDEEALATLDQALAMDPDNERVLIWIKKTRRKLAAYWFEIAREEHANDNLDAALEAYELSLSYDVDMTSSREGAASVLLQLNYRAGLGESYYTEGIRSLHDYFLEIARSRFLYSAKYRPGDPLPDTRVQEVDRLRAQERLALARTFESDEYYAAARNEYHLASLLDPDLPEATEGRERTARESEAQALIESARMMILRGDLASARERVEAGRGLTTLQSDSFDSLLQDIDDSRVDRNYQRALDLERDFRYPDAIAVYEELLEQREWYEDARARLDTLQDYVTRSNELYAAARTAGTDEERISYLRQIQILWPRFKDVDARLERLEGKP